MSDAKSKTRVFIKNNSAVTRYLLTEIIDQEHDMEVVGTVQDSAAAINRILTVNPDVTIVDMTDTGRDEILSMKRLLQNCSMPVIIIRSMPANTKSDSADIADIGAFDYVYKDSNLTWGGILGIADDIIVKIRSASANHIRTGFGMNLCGQMPETQTLTELP